MTAAGARPRFDPPADPRPDDRAWPRLRWPPPDDTLLRGRHVTVRPADPDGDAAALFAALDDDRVWAHVRGRPGGPEGWTEAIAARRDAGGCAWLIEVIDGGGSTRVVGTSSYLDVSVDDARLEIGWTAYAPSVWGTAVNPETKLLLLGYAFDQLGAGRVQLKTDIRNQRSMQAIARLGAGFEGVLRRYQRRSDDTVRDTVLFSIIAEEWPGVRAGLQQRLGSG